MADKHEDLRAMRISRSWRHRLGTRSSATAGEWLKKIGAQFDFAVAVVPVPVTSFIAAYNVLKRRAAAAHW